MNKGDRPDPYSDLSDEERVVAKRVEEHVRKQLVGERGTIHFTPELSPVSGRIAAAVALSIMDGGAGEYEVIPRIG